MMMLPLAMAATVNAASPSIVTNDQLPGLFIAACLDGTARTTGAATPIEFDALPGRRIVEGENSGIAVLDFAIGAGLAPDLWIVELGSNDLGKYAGFAGTRS